MKRALGIIFIICILLCGCQRHEVPASVDESITKGKPAYGGELSIYSFQADTLNPLLTQIKSNYDMLGLIFEPVVKNTPQGKAEGVIAEKWNKSADGMTYSLEIRSGVSFHNGDAVTLKDVASSIELAASEKSPFFSSLDMIERVRVSDGKVVINLINPVPNFINLLEVPVMQSASVNKAEGYVPIGTGPYVYDGSTKNKTYTLSANENWWQGKAYISKINVKILPDKTAVTYSYDAANIDVFSTDIITAGKYAGDGQSRIAYYTQDNLVFMGFNNLSIPFATLEARRAVASAIDKEKINEEAVFSNYIITETPVNPEKGIYNKDVAVYSPLSGGNPVDIVPFEIIACSASQVNSRIGEAIAQQLKTAGYAAALVLLDEEEYTSRVAAKQYDAFVGTFSLMANNDLSTLLGADNYFNYTSDLMEEYISALHNPSDDVTGGAYADIQRLYSEDLPFISLFFEKRALVIRNMVGGELMPLQSFVYNGVEAWYTKAD